MNVDAPYTLQARLFESFQKHGSRIALEHGNHAVSYSQLESRFTQICSAIKAKELEKGTFIGIYIANPMDFIAALLGVLTAGSVFMPLDTTLPPKRVETMLHTTGTRVLISDTPGYRQLLTHSPGLETQLETVILADCLENTTHLDTGSREYHPEDRIYIYFTSGSTDTPKAIIGKNKSLRHFIDWESETFHSDGETRFSQLMAIGFDAYLRDLFTPLFTGGRVCIPKTREILLDGSKLSLWLEKSKIHLVHLVPSLFRVLSHGLTGTQEGAARIFRHLKYILLSGEKINAHELKNWYEIVGNRIQLVNLYGPSETTLVKTYYFIREEDVKKGKIPIGKPMRGAQVILFDKAMKICSRGTVGEIFIRTPYRTYGYLNHRELNRRHFIPNPLSGNPQDLLYRTGDLGRELPGGDFEFLGRIDRQVKIRGVRIEPGEIESLLQGHPGIEAAVVLPLENQGDDPLLYAFYVSKTRAAERRIREYLFALLPDYMVPPYILRLDTIPLLPNGKIDGSELGTLARRMQSEAQYIAPRNTIEQKLANLWSRVLKKEKIGIHDHFFQLGGQSLEILSLASEIKKQFDVEMTLAHLFNHPRIAEMANYISLKQRGEIFMEYRDDPLVIFNKTGPRRLFCFPPQMGYGIAYKELSELLPGYAVYSFHFIEEPDRSRQYADLVEKICESGPYCFFGYSAGGNLAFETAQEMERRGKCVSDVIIMDSFCRPVTCQLGTAEELDRFLDNLAERMERMGLGFLKEKAIAKARNYTHYHERSVDRGVVSANLHLLTSTDRPQRESQLTITGPWPQDVPLSTSWEQHTSGDYFVYPGAGKHVQMLEPGNLEKNAEIIAKILLERKTGNSRTD
jgi:amino acid adenylation domain-containing protein